MVAGSTEAVGEVRRFSLTTSDRKVELQAGDYILFIEDGSPSNLRLQREDVTLTIRSWDGKALLDGAKRAFTLEEARLLAAGLAVGSGLAFVEEVEHNGAFMRFVYFRFVE